MEEKKEDKQLEHKNNVGLYATLVLCIIVVAFVVFIIIGAFKKLNPGTDDIIPKDNSRSVVEELLVYGIDTLYGQSKYMTNIDDYISSSDSDRCSYGIGCVRISNWDDINDKYTDNLVQSLSDEDGDYIVIIIDDTPYLKDGLNGIGIDTISNVKIINETDNKIEAKVFAVLIMYDQGIVTDAKGNSTNVKENKNVNITIVKEDDTWKIDSFKIESTK